MDGGATTTRGRLRLVTCGSVDDGKSTLIGRLLHDAGLLKSDQLVGLTRDSAARGADGLDFALLLDGLEVERAQAITIDVAWRFFATARRRFIAADCPGHEQYIRNMATGASQAELALLLCDASQGITTETRRHAAIAALFGIRHFVLAVNKMDLVGFAPACFATLSEEFRGFAARLDGASVTAIPLCARAGDNVVHPSSRMSWYAGPTLLAHLESVETALETQAQPFRMPVAWIGQAPRIGQNGAGGRVFAGTIAAGVVRPGDTIINAATGRTARMRSLPALGGDLAAAAAGDAAALMLDAPIDVARGDVLAAAEAPPAMTEDFTARLLWLDAAPLFRGRSYLFRLGTATVAGSISAIRHRLDIETLAPIAVGEIAENDIAEVEIALAAPLAAAPYAQCRPLGAFLVIDRMNAATAGVGMITTLSTRRTDMPHAGPGAHRSLGVDRAARAAIKGQRAALVWFTGLSAAGKSTIANLVERRLHALGRHTGLLDGDDIRHGLNRDLGFAAADRVENIRRVAEVARLFTDAGLIVLVSFISPYRVDRAGARAIAAPGEFLEVFVDTPLAECERRDPKGLYARARAGKIREFTGIDAPYEAPDAPELHLRTTGKTPDSLASQVIAALRERGFFG